MFGGAILFRSNQGRWVDYSWRWYIRAIMVVCLYYLHRLPPATPYFPPPFHYPDTWSVD